MTTEPAGAGTADEVVRVFFQHASIDHARNVERLAALIASAITAAESRAMERCAKIAFDFGISDALGMYTGHDPIKAAGDIAIQIAAAIRSSINPPGEEE